MRLVQPAGQPAPFDLVICYYTDIRLDAAVRAAWPEAMILNETREAFKGAHREFGSGRITPLSDVFAQYKLQQSDVRNLILLAFSEGNQALRLQLLSGAKPSAIVSIDGIHGSPWPGTKSGQVQNYHVVPYRDFALDAASGDRVFIITHSQIIPPDFPPVKDVVANILYPDGEQPLSQPLDFPGSKYQQTTEFAKGGLLVEGYSGGDEQAHVFQAVTVLPQKLAQARAMLDGHAIGFDLGAGRQRPLTAVDITPWKNSESGQVTGSSEGVNTPGFFDRDWLNPGTWWTPSFATALSSEEPAPVFVPEGEGPPVGAVQIPEPEYVRLAEQAAVGGEGGEAEGASEETVSDYSMWYWIGGFALLGAGFFAYNASRK